MKKNARQIEQRLLDNNGLTVIMISHHFSEETKSKLYAVYSIYIERFLSISKNSAKLLTSPQQNRPE